MGGGIAGQTEARSGGDAAMAVPLPDGPMIPVADERLPEGPDWLFQLKWDGVRMLARLDGRGGVELYSRRMLLRNGTYPEIAAMLAARSAELGPCLLDGEVVYWNGARPEFRKVLQRERAGGPGRVGGGSGEGLIYVLFDLLHDGAEDLRPRPCAERIERLGRKLPARSPMLLVTDTFADGEALWRWVEANGWEGIVSKRASSPYAPDKKHRDWLKKKTALQLDVDIVGLKLREGRVASLVMALDGIFVGSVSLGLTDTLRARLLERYVRPSGGAAMPFPALPPELKGERMFWLAEPFPCKVTGTEITSAGLLRHPKLARYFDREGTP